MDRIFVPCNYLPQDACFNEMGLVTGPQTTMVPKLKTSTSPDPVVNGWRSNCCVILPSEVGDAWMSSRYLNCLRLDLSRLCS